MNQNSRAAAPENLLLRTVLLVDDMKVYLEGHRVNVLEAEDGHRALSLARLLPVKLAVVDIRMPKMDGLEFTRAVRKDPRLKDMPIALLTGDHDASLRRVALEAGATAFLRKPVAMNEVNELIARFIPTMAALVAERAAAASP
jgi:CheY-like chemotaxis protein